MNSDLLISARCKAWEFLPRPARDFASLCQHITHSSSLPSRQQCTRHPPLFPSPTKLSSYACLSTKLAINKSTLAPYNSSSMRIHGDVSSWPSGALIFANPLESQQLCYSCNPPCPPLPLHMYIPFGASTSFTTTLALISSVMPSSVPHVFSNTAQTNQHVRVSST